MTSCKLIGSGLVGVVLIASLGIRSASAAPILSLGPGNQAISSFSFTVSGTQILINETFLSLGLGTIQFSGLEPGVDYTVVKTVINGTASTFTRFSNELLDPVGQGEDALDLLPYPSFVPGGYSTSNDQDGLSFAQGSPIPRTSTAFASVLSDEATEARDYIDFFNGSVGPSASFSMSFGLRDNTGLQQPFLLAQRPNVVSAAVPEPGSTALFLGFALVTIGAVRRAYRI